MSNQHNYSIERGIEPTDLKNLRIKTVAKQSDVAKFLGVSRPTYIKWENNILLMPIGRYLQALNYINTSSNKAKD